MPQLVEQFEYFIHKYCYSYARMYKDVRAAVDLCHRDGTLKQMVAKDPKRLEYRVRSILKLLKWMRGS